MRWSVLALVAACTSADPKSDSATSSTDADPTTPVASGTGGPGTGAVATGTGTGTGELTTDDSGTAPFTPFEGGVNVVVDGVVVGDGGVVDLGAARLGYDAVVTTITVANPTDAQVTLGGDPRDWIVGDAAIGWSAPPPTSIPAGGTVGLEVRLDPVVEGPASAALELPASTGAVVLSLVGRVDPALRWVIVGRLARTLISDDYGLSWPYDEQETLTEDQWWNNRNLEEVVYAEGRFVAVGGAESGRFVSSVDGETWIDTHDSDGILSALAYGNGLFVAESGGDLWWSETGELWVEESHDWRGGLSKLAFGSGRFVGVGGARRAVTLDGKTWEADSDFAGSLGTLVYGGGVFVAVGADGLVSSTTDGITWNDQVIGTANRDGVVWTGTQFVTGGWPDGMLFSADGTVWTERDGDQQIAPQGYANGHLVGWSWRDRVWVSTDGLGWTLTKDDSNPERAGYTAMALQVP